MAWADNLRSAESLLHKKGSLRDAFLRAFQALDTCYKSVARQHGWHPGARDESTFWALAGWLRERELISDDDYEMATSVRGGRNTWSHIKPSSRQQGRYSAR